MNEFLAFLYLIKNVPEIFVFDIEIPNYKKLKNNNFIKRTSKLNYTKYNHVKSRYKSIKKKIDSLDNSKNNYPNEMEISCTSRSLLNRINLVKNHLNIVKLDSFCSIFLENKSKFAIKLLKHGLNLIQCVREENQGKSKKMSEYLREKKKNKNFFNIYEYCLISSNNKLFIEIFQQYETIEIYLNAAFLSSNFTRFKIVFEGYFLNNISKIYDFIVKKGFVMKLAQKGNEEFLIQLFENYIKPCGQVII